MGSTLLKCAIVGAVVVYLWNAFSWMVLPWHQNTIYRFDNEEYVASIILQNAPKSGMYFITHKGMGSEYQDYDQRSYDDGCKGSLNMGKGPMVFAAVNKRPWFHNISPVRPALIGSAVLLTAFFIQLIGAFLVAWLLAHIKPLTYWTRVAFVTVIGLVAGVITYLPGWHWWGFDPTYVALGMIDLVIAWFLAGLAMVAVMMRSKKH